MAIPRKDVKFRLDEGAHSALSGYCAVHDIFLYDYVERAVLKQLRDDIDKATLVAEATRNLKITGNSDVPELDPIP